MSKYENYDSASRNYDNQRFAMGSDVIAAMIQFHCGKPLKDLHVLDAGCGTGNYAKALIEYGVGQVTLLDASPGMLEKAKVKLAGDIESGKVKEVVEATMPPIPFPDATFDAVMFNLVLHHLEKEPDGVKFPTIEKVLIEAKRVVKPDGVVAITSGPPPSVYETIWFMHLNRDIATRHLKLYPHDRQWHVILQNCGLLCLNYAQIKVDVPEKSYKALLDPEGPLKKEWRDCNSYWASATEEDLKVVEKNVNEMKQNGTLKKFVETHDTAEGFYVISMIIGKPVLHHLQKDDSEDFARATQALQEAARVLRPGGSILVSTVLPSTITHSLWYSQLNMKFTERFNKIIPSVEQFEQMFQASSLHCIQKLNILGSDMIKDYYNFEGPLDKSWRDSVSYWNFATADELEDVKQKILELKQEGQLEKWARQHDSVNTSGFLTVLICKYRKV